MHSFLTQFSQFFSSWRRFSSRLCYPIRCTNVEVSYCDIKLLLVIRRIDRVFHAYYYTIYHLQDATKRSFTRCVVHTSNALEMWCCSRFIQLTHLSSILIPLILKIVYYRCHLETSSPIFHSWVNKMEKTSPLTYMHACMHKHMHTLKY